MFNVKNSRIVLKLAILIEAVKITKIQKYKNDIPIGKCFEIVLKNLISTNLFRKKKLKIFQIGKIRNEFLSKLSDFFLMHF